MRRILAAAAIVALGSLVSVGSPAAAASGPWSVVAAGESHSCAINTGRSLFCWGYNDYGQVGDGTILPKSSPTRIGASGAWSSVSAGGGNGAGHTCAITTGKSLYCWGSNDFGAIGDGTDVNRHRPKKIGTSGVWASVATGAFHTCAITTGKSLYCWGNNISGQIGDGTFGSPANDRHSPRRIGTAGAWAGVTAGDQHTCAITTGHSLYCWGFNISGQIGDGGPPTERPSPRKVGATGVWALADAGDSHTCAVTTGRSLYCWGHNAHGQIGDGSTGTDQLSPKQIGTTGAWANLSGGGTLTCATTIGDSLYCWGNNESGQIGDGTTAQRPSPRKIGTAGVWASATAGGRHTCAVSTGHSMYCWGLNQFGQIGDGTDIQRLSPTKVP